MRSQDRAELLGDLAIAVSAGMNGGEVAKNLTKLIEDLRDG